MDLGATICTPRSPACALCPWREPCAARSAGTQESFPRKARRRPSARCAAAPPSSLSRADGAVLLRTRAAKGPARRHDRSADQRMARRLRRRRRIADAPLAARWRRLPATVAHVFTHFPLELDGLRRATSRPRRARPPAMPLGAPLADARRRGAAERRCAKVIAAIGLEAAGLTPSGRLRRVGHLAGAASLRSTSIGASAPSSRRARRSSHCRPAGPAPARRPCGSSPTQVAERQRAVGAHHRLVAALLVGERSSPGADEARLDERHERHARLAALRTAPVANASGGSGVDRGDALRRGLGIDRVALDADEVAAERLGDRAGRAGAEERVEHHVAGIAWRRA